MIQSCLKRAKVGVCIATVCCNIMYMYHTSFKAYTRTFSSIDV